MRKYESPLILQKAPEERMTLQQLTDEWYMKLESVKAKKHYKILQINPRNFNTELGCIVISVVKPDDLENYQVKRKAASYSDAYVDYELGAARTMITECVRTKSCHRPEINSTWRSTST